MAPPTAPRSPPTTDASPQAAYDAWHDALPVDDTADTPWHRLLRTRLVPPRDLAGRRILEIGCGRGGFACWLASCPESERPAEIVAADFSPAALVKGQEHAARLGLPAGLMKWEPGDIQAITHPAGSFDTVFSCETIEHVPDPRGAVRELARVLRPGGKLFLTFPNYLGTMGIYRGYLRLTGRRYREEGQPINRFLLLPLVRRWVKEAGLDVETTDAVGHYLPFPGRPPIPLPALDSPSIRFVARWAAVHGFVLARKR